MSKLTLEQSFQISGEWFLPDSPKKIAGTLSWEPHKALLSLHNTFDPLQGAIHAHSTKKYPAIFGNTIDGNLFTVLNAMTVNNGINIGVAGAVQSAKLQSNYILGGGHVTESTLFSEVNFRIPGLQIWLSKSVATMSVITKTESNPLAINYYVASLAEETFYLPDIETTLGWGFENNFSGDLITDINVKINAVLRIKPDAPKTLDWFFEQLGKVTTLLSFLADSPMSPDYIEASLANGSGTVDVLVALRENSYCIHKNNFNFYMLRSGMKIDFSIVFKKWFELYETVSKPSQLALSVFSSEKLWLHVEFLSLMQALEGFHRATMEGVYTTQAKYKAIQDTLTNAIPSNVSEGHKASLKARIKFGNEISLRKRLNDLVGRLDLNLRKYIFNNDGTLPGVWVDTRNYYTHWDESSAKSILDGYEMHKANVRMKHFLRALYLELVGIPQDAIFSALTNTSRESQYLIQLNNSEHHEKNPDDKSGAIMHIEVINASAPK